MGNSQAMEPIDEVPIRFRWAVIVQTTISEAIELQAAQWSVTIPALGGLLGIVPFKARRALSFQAWHHVAGSSCLLEVYKRSYMNILTICAEERAALSAPAQGPTCKRFWAWKSKWHKGPINLIWEHVLGLTPEKERVSCGTEYKNVDIVSQFCVMSTWDDNLSCNCVGKR